MSGHLRVWLPLSAALLALGAASATQAGGPTKGCGCKPPPPPPPSCNSCGGQPHHHHRGGININANANANASANASSSSLAIAGSSNAIVTGGGGSSWYVGDGPTSVISDLRVEAGEFRKICIEKIKQEKVVAIQAVCLDDKSVPHPASQVLPERDVAPGYEGEVYRCIAGSRMQYTIADFSGQANFDHGQTSTCQKGEALYHSANGQLACRPQKAARDCNERSLLRRYGAGIKVLKVAGDEVCKTWKTEGVESRAGGSMILDGGVGGVVH